jgi:hypothetical protein
VSKYPSMRRVVVKFPACGACVSVPFRAEGTPLLTPPRDLFSRESPGRTRQTRVASGGHCPLFCVSPLAVILPVGMNRLASLHRLTDRRLLQRVSRSRDD